MSNRKELYNKTIKSVEDEIEKSISSDITHYMAFLDLEKNQQYIVFKLMLDAFKIVFLNSLKLQIPITLPYIGKVKIKTKNKIVLKFKEEVARELNYDKFDNIYGDDLDKAKQLLKNKIDANIKSYLKQEKETAKLNKQLSKESSKKVGVTRSKIKALKFNIKKVIK